MSRPVSKPKPKSARCGPYELLVRIGKGGMASVYLARHADDDSPEPELFALKILHPNLGRESEFVDMLMDEAKIASQLKHPNVVGTVDIGHDEQRYYMVMDYVEGVALDRLLRRTTDARDPALIVPLAIDALQGLQAAHELKDEVGRPLELVHRDVTPGNVIIGVDGRGRIADFGVAKARARITKTNPGVVKGKAGYIAPEVILGRDIDGRADVFSMGVLLWNSLTGETLFDTDDLASSLTALLQKEVPPPSEIGLMPPPIFDAPILGALHRDPSLRHESAAEMAEALSDALLIYGKPANRIAIGSWVRGAFGEQLDKRRGYATRDQAESAWEPDQAEQLSTSAMVRKDPTGRVISAYPRSMTDAERKEAAAEGATDAPPKKGGAGKIVLGVLALLVMLVGAGLAGAYIATDGQVFAPEAPPEPEPEPTPVEDVAPPEDDVDPELSPELFGGGGEAPVEEPAAEAEEEEARPRARRRRERPEPAAEETEEPATEAAPPETTEEPAVEPAAEAEGEEEEPQRRERGPATVVEDGVEYIAPPPPPEVIEETVVVPAE